MGIVLTREAVDLSDLIEVRQLIEPFAAALAVERPESGTCQVLRLSGKPILPVLAMPVRGIDIQI